MFFNSTTECDGSFVKIASKDAIEMATKTLAWVDKLRSDRQAGTIEIEQQRINNGFFHKLFRMKEATVEDAKKNLAYDHWNFDYHFNGLIAHKNESAANRILNAAKHADEIYISTEDLQRIS
jgi:hypothetical protein